MKTSAENTESLRTQRQGNSHKVRKSHSEGNSTSGQESSSSQGKGGRHFVVNAKSTLLLSRIYRNIINRLLCQTVL